MALTLLTSLGGCSTNSNSNTIPVNNENISSSNTTPVINTNKSTSNTALVNNESKSGSTTTPVNDDSNTTESNTPQVNEVFYGDWTVKNVVTTTPIFSLGNEDIKQLLGAKLSYSPDSVSFEGNVLKKAYYKTQVSSKNDFFASNRVSFEQLGVSSGSITEIHVYANKDFTNEWLYTNPDSEGGQTYIKDENTLLMEVGGVFFELVRNG